VGNNCCGNTSDGIEIVTGAIRTMISSNACNSNTGYGISANFNPATPSLAHGNLLQSNVAGGHLGLGNLNWNSTANV
jgi:hypothetical protein